MSVVSDPDAQAEDPPDTRSPLRAVAVSVGLTVAALVVSVLGGVVLVVPIVLYGLDVESAPVFLALTAAGQLGFLAVGYGYARYASLPVRLAVPDRRETGYVLGGTVAAIALAYGLSVLLTALGLVPGSVIGDVATETPSILLGLAVLSILVIAPVEEFLFRGVIQTRLRRAFGPAGAIVGAGLLFGSLHLANYTGAAAPIIAGALLVGTVGMVFGWLYERTGNLTVPVLSHGAYNALLLGLSFVTL